MVDIIKKWYQYLDFPKEYDEEFYAVLERRAGDLFECDPHDFQIKEYEQDLEICLLMGLYFIEVTHQRYMEKGYSKELFDETMQDIVIWTKTCKEVNGRIGLESPMWFLNNHVKLNMFRFGRLQYRPLISRKQLDAHVPNGGPLTVEACLESFDRALEFFTKFYPDVEFESFYIGTWLLDKTVLQFLGEDSNIAKFQKLWEPYEYMPNNDGVLGFILGWGCTENNIDKYPPKNRFAKEIANFVKNGGQLHVVLATRKIER